MFRTLLASSTAIAAFLAPAAAQEVQEDTLFVTAARRPLPAEDLPQKIRLIGRDEVLDQLAISSNVFDIIGQSVPSLSPSRQKLSGFGESFRGREPLYLIDGVPQSNPLRNGSRDGFTLDPAVIERVEVLFGANAIQGVGATGGVINYVTLSPTTEDRWQSRFEAGVNSADSFEGDGYGTRAAATVLRDFGAVDLVASGAVEQRGAFYDAEGRRIGIDGTQGDIQDSLSTNIFLKTGWDLDPATRLQFTMNLFELEGDGDYVQLPGDRGRDIPATSVRGTSEGQPPTNSVNTFSLDFQREGVLGGRLTAQAFYREFEAVFGGGTFGGFFNTGDEEPGEETFDQSANNSNKTGAKVTWSRSDLPIAGLTATAGFDWLRDETYQELIQTGRLWVPEVTFNSYAPFIQFDQKALDGRLLVSAGMRHEEATLDVPDFTTIFSSGSTAVGDGEPGFSETLANVGASFEAIRGLTVYGTYSEGFTMPDVGRVLRGVSTSGQDVDDLLNVEPIIADNTEVGFQIDQGPLSATVAYFWSESDFGQRLVANAEGIFEVQRERTEIEGLELSADVEMSENVTVGGGYARIEGRFDSDADGKTDQDLSGVNVSPDRLNLYAAIDATEHLSLRVQGSHFFSREFDDEGEATDFEGYTLLDFLASYDLGSRGRIDVGVQNLLDEDYFTYYSQTGTTAADRFFAGRGRTLTLRWLKNF